MGELVDLRGRPIGETEAPVLVDPDGRPLSSDEYEEVVEEDPVEAVSPVIDTNAEEVRQRASSSPSPIQPAAVAADLIAKQRIQGLSRSERELLRMSLVANEMATQNLILWVALHGVSAASGIESFQVTTDKLRKWGETHPTKWPISAARMASGAVAFEILPEIPTPGGTEIPREEIPVDIEEISSER